MIPTGASVRPLPRRKGPRGVRQVEVSPGRWMDEAVAEAQGIPLSYPLPTHTPSPVTVRHAEPEVPMPAPANPASLPPVALMSPPTARQREAWAAYHAHGGQTAAGRVLGIHQAAVRSSLVGYMRAVGIEGPIPPPDASLVGGPERVPLGSDVDAPSLAAPVVDGTDGQTHVRPMSDVGPANIATLDADTGHEMTASTGGEPEPASPAKGTPAPHHPDPDAEAPPPDVSEGGAVSAIADHSGPVAEPGSSPLGATAVVGSVRPIDPSVEADGAATASYIDLSAALARLARERDEMQMARDELREMLDDAMERVEERPARERYLDVLLSALAAHPTDHIRDRIERALGIEVDRDAWADGYRRALGDLLDVVRSTRGTAYPHQDIIERIARLAIAVPMA